MLIKFTSKASGAVLMLGEHALPVLTAAGKVFEGGVLPVRGVFTVQQLPAAIESLKTAMAAAPEVNDDLDDDDGDNVKPHPMSKAVGFKQRAYPLYEMLIESLEKDEDVMWEPADNAW